MQAHDNLIMSAANLAKTAPTQWREFLACLAAYTDVHRDNLLKSQLPELPVNQGRAQALTTLQDTLAKCIESADKIARKAKP